MQKVSGGKVTSEVVKNSLPIDVSDVVAEKVRDVLNMENSEVLRYAYLKNMVALGNVCKDTSVSPMEYTYAVFFVTRLMTGETAIDAFKDIFKKQYKDMVLRGDSEVQILRSIKAYHGSPLIVDLLEQAVIPVHLMYQDVYHKAIGAQVSLMQTAMSEMVKMNAAKCLLEILKPPEAVKIELDIKAGGSVIEELQNTTRKLAEQQKILLEQGASVKDLAEADIIEIVQEKEPETVQ